jgi:hypothetical protein
MVIVHSGLVGVMDKPPAGPETAPETQVNGA